MARAKLTGILGVAAVAALAAAISTAHAADMDFAPAPSVLGYDWSGFYVGAVGGYFGSKAKNHGYVDLYAPDDSLIYEGDYRFNLKPSGGVFGGYAGYNWQMPGSGFVVGIEGDINGVWGKDSTTLDDYSYIYDDGNGGVDMEGDIRAKQKVTSTWAVRGRMGWAIESFMPYVAGGYAGASMKTTLSDTNPIGPGSRSKTHTYTGWTIGGGMDFLVTPNWVLGLDYQYKDLGKKTTRFLVEYPVDAFDFAEADVAMRTKLRANQFTVRGSYKF